MVLRFRNTAHLKMTLLITGPIARGHYGYYKKLANHFQELLSQVDPHLKDRVYLALLFGELDRESFKERYKNPAGIAELYNISSLVLLPSKDSRIHLQSSFQEFQLLSEELLHLSVLDPMEHQLEVQSLL